MPKILVISVEAEERTTMDELSDKRGSFSVFKHLKVVFHDWIILPMLLYPICTSCSILVKLIGFNVRAENAGPQAEVNIMSYQ